MSWLIFITYILLVLIIILLYVLFWLDNKICEFENLIHYIENIFDECVKRGEENEIQK